MSELSFNQPLEDEISLKDIIDFLSESWKEIALSGIVGGLLATGYVFITPPQYQAVANIQVARVAGSDVEAPSTLVEKLKMPMYYSTESYSACNVMDTIEPGAVIAKNIKPTLSKTAPIISFSFKEDSPDSAKKCLESVLNDVRKSQNLLAKPILESKKNQLTNLKQKLDSAERIIKNLPNENSNFDFTDSKFSVFTLLLATSLSRENEIKDLLNQINDLEIALSEPVTRETFLTTPIYSPKQKVSPKRALILMGGLVTGLFLGLFFMIGKRRWHNLRMSNPQPIFSKKICEFK
jgi:uncharacterized protein involved in exopolysaccharide biosynthesis